MKQIAKVTVILEDTEGTEHITKLEAIPNRPFAEFEWTREPVEDTDAMMRDALPYRAWKPSPYAGIKLEAYGAVIDEDREPRRRERPAGTP